MKLDNYDPVVMGNTGFKFQLDQMHGLAARIFFFFNVFFLFFIVLFVLFKAHVAVPGRV